MRIGILGQFPDPENPNVSKAGYRQVSTLAMLLSEDHEVTLYSLHKHKLNINLTNCRVIHIYSSNPLLRLIKLTYRLFEQRKKIDVFIVHNPSIFATAIIFLKILTHLSVVVDYTDRQATPLYSPNKLVRLLSFFSENLFLRTMENWLTDSKDLEDNVRRVRKKKEVNIMLYRSMIPQSASLNSKTKTLPLEIAPNKVNIAYSGALLYDHGVDILIDAFSELPLDKVHLYITGHGPARPTLEDKIKREKLAENVTITFLDNEVFDDFLLRMDILVIPYRDTKKIRLIGFPSKILSYTWAGKAIIATNTTELPDLLKHGETANLVSPDSKEALKDALVELVTNKERRKELGLNARKYFDDNLSPEVVGPSINDYLLTVVNSHKD